MGPLDRSPMPALAVMADLDRFPARRQGLDGASLGLPRLVCGLGLAIGLVAQCLRAVLLTLRAISFGDLDGPVRGVDPLADWMASPSQRLSGPADLEHVGLLVAAGRDTPEPQCPEPAKSAGLQDGVRPIAAAGAVDQGAVLGVVHDLDHRSLPLCR